MIRCGLPFSEAITRPEAVEPDHLIAVWTPRPAMIVRSPLGPDLGWPKGTVVKIAIPHPIPRGRYLFCYQPKDRVAGPLLYKRPEIDEAEGAFRSTYSDMLEDWVCDYKNARQWLKKFFSAPDPGIEGIGLGIETKGGIYYFCRVGE